MLHYILDAAGNPKLETDPIVWAKWMAKTTRIVVQTRIPDYASAVLTTKQAAEETLQILSSAVFFVSTIFLGIDHGFGHDATFGPVLWESMLFEESGDTVKGDTVQWRYRSSRNALQGHNELVARATKLYRQRMQGLSVDDDSWAQPMALSH